LTALGELVILMHCADLISACGRITNTAKACLNTSPEFSPTSAPLSGFFNFWPGFRGWQHSSTHL
jgi:hypothetical protein